MAKISTQRGRLKEGKQEAIERRRDSRRKMRSRKGEPLIRKEYSSHTHTHTGQSGVNVLRLWRPSEDEQSWSWWRKQ